jgi:hypothetical protein
MLRFRFTHRYDFFTCYWYFIGKSIP